MDGDNYNTCKETSVLHGIKQERLERLLRGFVAISGLSLVAPERLEKEAYSICHAAFGCNGELNKLENTCPVVKEGLELTEKLLKEFEEYKVIRVDRYLDLL